MFKRRRAVELKHGRVAMLAVTGYLVQSVARLPGNIDLDGEYDDEMACHLFFHSTNAINITLCKCFSKQIYAIITNTGHTFASIPNGIAAGGAVPLLGTSV